MSQGFRVLDMAVAQPLQALSSHIDIGFGELLLVLRISGA